MKLRYVLAVFAAFVCCSGVQAQAGDDVVSAMKTQAGLISYQIDCTTDYLNRRESKLVGVFNRADFIQASSLGEVVAAEAASCGLKFQDAMVEWADRTGTLLAMGVIAATKIPGGTSTPMTVASGKRAEVLLAYAKKNGSPSAAEALMHLKSSKYWRY